MEHATCRKIAKSFEPESGSDYEPGEKWSVFSHVSHVFSHDGLVLYILTLPHYCCKRQFKDNGCENCMFFHMDKDHDRVVECTTPNFAG